MATNMGPQQPGPTDRTGEAVLCFSPGEEKVWVGWGIPAEPFSGGLLLVKYFVYI